MGGTKRGATFDASPPAAKKVPSAIASPIPVQKPEETQTGNQASSVAVSNLLARPVRPSLDDEANCDVEAWIKLVRSYCEQELPGAFGQCPGLTQLCVKKPFWQCPALSIGVSHNGSLVGHKEPFDQVKC